MRRLRAIGGKPSPQVSAQAAPLPGRRASAACIPHGGTPPERRQRTGAPRQRFSCDARYYLRLTLTRPPLCRSCARAQVWNGGRGAKSVDNARMSRDPGGANGAIRLRARRRRLASAPGAAHALADALGAVDGAARGHEAAHAAAVGREAPAIGAAAAEVTGPNDLAVASHIQAGGLGLDLGGREGGQAAGDQRQSPRVSGSHRQSPGTLLSRGHCQPGTGLPQRLRTPIAQLGERLCPAGHGCDPQGSRPTRCARRAVRSGFGQARGAGRGRLAHSRETRTSALHRCRAGLRARRTARPSPSLSFFPGVALATGATTLQPPARTMVARRQRPLVEPEWTNYRRWRDRGDKAGQG